MVLAEKIFDLRKKHKLSQEELADKMAVSRQSVSKWENGTSIPEIDKIVQMSKLFNVSTDYLLTNELKSNEDYKDIVLEKSKTGKTSLYSLLQATMTIIFLILGFVFNIWHSTWVLFLIPWPVISIINYTKNDNMKLLDISYSLATIIFVILGVLFNLWHPAWTVFLLPPLFKTISNLKAN